MVQGFAKQIGKDLVKAEEIQVFHALAQDEQDSVRLLAVENCVANGTLLSQDENSQLVLPVIRACCQDKSWRVRYMVADKFCEVCHTSTCVNFFVLTKSIFTQVV